MPSFPLPMYLRLTKNLLAQLVKDMFRLSSGTLQSSGDAQKKYSKQPHYIEASYFSGGGQPFHLVHGPLL